MADENKGLDCGWGRDLYYYCWDYNTRQAFLPHIRFLILCTSCTFSVITATNLRESCAALLAPVCTRSLADFWCWDGFGRAACLAEHWMRTWPMSKATILFFQHFLFFFVHISCSQLVRVNIHQAAFHVRHQQLLLFGGVFVRQLRFMMQIIHAAKRIKNRQRRRTDDTSKSFPHEKCITMQSNLTKQLLAKVGIHCFTLTNWRVRPDRVCCLSESLPPSRCRHDCHRWGV